MASLVMVVSGANVWTMKNAKPHPTGFWAEEFVTPHRKFTEAGLKITVASPGGVAPTVDPLSFNVAYNSNDADKVQEQQIAPSLPSCSFQPALENNKALKWTLNPTHSFCPTGDVNASAASS